MTSLRILFVTPYVPSPLRVRPYNLIRQLGQRNHRVTVVSLCTAEEVPAAASLRAECERVHTLPLQWPRALWNCVRQQPAGIPLQALYTYSIAMEHLLQAELCAAVDTGRQGPYDLMHVEHLRAARFGLITHGLPRVFDAVDCISRLLRRTATLATSRMARCTARIDLNRTRRFEAWLIRQFERTLTASEADRQALAQLAAQVPQHDSNGVARPSGNPGPPWITVLPNGVDARYFRPTDTLREAATLVFVGRMGYHANVTAILRFVRDGMPLIWARRPAARLLLVGAHPARAVRRLARLHGPRVEVTGYVADTRPFVARATVSVSPLVYAVGMQNKILEAMAMGTPVVATPAGCTALQAHAGTDLLVAEDPAQFAHAVLRLLEDAALHQRLAENGRRYVEAHHDWNAVGAHLEDAYREAIACFQQRGGAPHTNRVQVSAATAGRNAGGGALA